MKILIRIIDYDQLSGIILIMLKLKSPVINLITFIIIISCNIRFYIYIISLPSELF